jgi:hypothetical protein
VRIRRALTGLLAAALAALAIAEAARAAASPPGESGSSGKAAAAIAANWMSLHPEEATRLGDHRWDTRLPDVSEPGLRAAGEPPGTTHAPEWFLARLRVAIVELLRGNFSSPCVRADRLARRLVGAPEYLRNATVHLSRARGRGTAFARLEVEFALDETDALLELCRDNFEEFVRDCRESRVQAPLAESDTLTVRALEAFRDFLKTELLPSATEGSGDDRAFEASLHRVRGDSAAIDFAALSTAIRQEMDSLGAAVPAESTIDSAFSPSVFTFNVLLDSLRTLPAKVRLVSIPEGLRVTVRNRTPMPGAVAPEPLAAPGPWEARRDLARLDLGGWGPHASGALARDPRRTRASIELWIVRDGIPGRALAALVGARRGPDARSLDEVEAMSDAWARYVERSSAERLDHPRHAALAREHAELERERLARALAELRLHVEHDSPERVADWLATAAGLTPDDARRAVRLAAARPQFTASTLALRELVGLREELRRERGARFDAVAFHDAVLRAGPVPMSIVRSDVRAELTAGAR